jgi:hypothetical protein
MIICPNCQHHEISGALFCSECGAQLVFSTRMATQAIRKNPSDTLESQPAVPTPPAGLGEGAMLSIHLVDSGQIVPLSGRAEFTLGRVTEGQPIVPDIDLSQYEAYAQGVSRLHAILKVVNQRIVVMDLGSSNGTRVNGQKIIPHVDYPVNHGDMLALGKLKIQVLIRR